MALLVILYAINTMLLQFNLTGLIGLKFNKMDIEKLIKESEEILHEPTLMDGLQCIHMVLDVALTGNDELIKELENGRR
jgi:hypothetical protein